MWVRATVIRSAAAVGFCGALLASCGPAPEEVAEIKKNQEQILAKVNELGAKIEKIKIPAAPAAAPQPGRPDPNTVYSMPVGKSAVKGPADAWVTVVEVSDFQCPFCKRVGPTLAEVQEKYGDDVRFVFKQNPLSFHQRAMPAARASACAGDQGKFWEMHDALFANQQQLNDPDLEKYAGDIGVDVVAWKACYASDKHDAAIAAEQQQAVALGARGTPAFFINGRYLSGAQPFAAFQTLIDAELKKAKDSGIPKGEYYAKTVEAKGQKKM
jgi:protein-disulfide isomerase